MGEARQIDQALTDARHQRELAELELLTAQDDLNAAREQRQGVERIARFDASMADRDVYLQRMIFRQMSANLELLTYDLYVLQKAFEYEFDARIDEIFSRWPALQKFRPLLELSPGSLTGEFDRTNVHRDLLEQSAQLEDLPDVVQLVRDLALGARYRDSYTLSIKDDFPIAWDRFKRNGPLLFEISLREFMGLSSNGRPMRHSIKIKSLRFEPVICVPKEDLVSLSNEKDPDKEDFKYCLASPVDVGTWRTREATLRSSKQAKLVEKHPNRLTWAAFHAGEGWQIGENGALRWIEWGPQVADSNYEAEEVKNYYNALEGLTPASRWVIDYDRSTGLLPKHFGNVLVTIEFTYGMIEENIRQTFAAGISEQLGAVTEFQSAPRIIQDATAENRTDARAARAFVRRRIQAVHER